MTSVKFNLTKMDFFNVVHRVPCSQEANGHDGNENNDKISELQLHRIGIHNKGAVSSPEPNQTEPDLYPANQGAEYKSGKGPDHGDQKSFEQKYPADQSLAGTHAPQHGNIFFLVQDKHRQGSDHIEGGDDQDKGEDHEDIVFL